MYHDIAITNNNYRDILWSRPMFMHNCTTTMPEVSICKDGMYFNRLITLNETRWIINQ